VKRKWVEVAAAENVKFAVVIAYFAAKSAGLDRDGAQQLKYISS
jgi:hypothetical protein